MSRFVVVVSLVVSIVSLSACSGSSDVEGYPFCDREVLTILHPGVGGGYSADVTDRFGRSIEGGYYTPEGALVIPLCEGDVVYEFYNRGSTPVVVPVTFSQDFRGFVSADVPAYGFAWMTDEWGMQYGFTQEVWPHQGERLVFHLNIR